MTERRCVGRTRTLRRCRRKGEWRLFCEDHKRQPLRLALLAIAVGGSFASIYGVCCEDDGASRVSMYRAWAEKVDEYSALDDHLRRWESEYDILRCGEPAENVADLESALNVAQVPVAVREIYRKRQRKFEALEDYATELDELGHRLEEDEFLIPRPPLLPAGFLPVFAEHSLGDIDCYFGALHGPCARIFAEGGLVLPRDMFPQQMPQDLMLYFSASETPKGIFLDLLSANRRGEPVVRVERNRWAVSPGLRWASDEQRLEVVDSDHVPLFQIWMNLDVGSIFIGGQFFDRSHRFYEATPAFLRSTDLLLAFVDYAGGGGWSAKLAVGGGSSEELMKVPVEVMGKEFGPKLEAWFSYDGCPTLLPERLKLVEWVFANWQ